MKILISGKDCSHDPGSRIAAEAAERMRDPRCAFLPPEISALSLRDARTEREYDDQFVRLVRAKSPVNTQDFDLPPRPGLAGAVYAAVRKFLWRLLRYQHDRVVFRQNFVNAQVASALEFQQSEIRRLEERVRALEDRTKGT